MPADLNFVVLRDSLPDGAVVEAAGEGDILISLKALMGEQNLDIGDAKVSEAVSKLLDGCARAQTKFNTSSATDLNSYPAPTPGIPIQGTDGQWYATFTHTITVNVPLNRDQTSGVIL